MKTEVSLYVGEALGKYGFPNGHPFGPDRQDAFWKEAVKQGLDKEAALCEPRPAAREEIRRFHTDEHVERVDHLSRCSQLRRPVVVLSPAESRAERPNP